MRSRVWLVHLINGLVHREQDEGTHGEDFEAWLDEQCLQRGYAEGLPRSMPSQALEQLGPVPEQLVPLVSHVGHQIDMAHLVLRTYFAQLNIEHSLRVLSAVALAHHQEDIGLELLRASDCEQRSWTQSLSDHAAAIGTRILSEKVTGEDRVAGLPFHHLSMLSEVRLCARIARVIGEATDGLVDQRELHRVEGVGRGIIYRALSASIALVAVDGEIDRDERRIINLLMTSAHLDATEKRMFKSEFKAPLNTTELSAGQICPWEVRFLVKHLLVVSYLNGRLDERELKFVAELAGSMGMNSDEYRLLEDEACAQIREGSVSLSPNEGKALWEQLRKTMIRRLERIIRANADNIWGEVQDTRELLSLLTQSTQRPLTERERTKVREQLVDVARTVPALAIFAAPGGGILLPLLIKHLPIELRPSHFIDEASFSEEEHL